MKIIFLGTPQFAVPTLKALHNSHHEVVAVVSQPQKVAGRGKKVMQTPVEKFARENNIPVYQFENISRDGGDILANIEADVLVSCAYGQMLRENILTLKKYGVINVHGSVLPSYRGASPIQWTILNGEEHAGISILKSEIGMDDGDVLKTFATPVLKWETASELFERLSTLAPEVLLETLLEIENGTAIYTPQNHELATKCKKLTKNMSVLDFSLPANVLVNHINGINMWPVASVNTVNGVLKIYKAKLVESEKLQSFGFGDLSEYKNGEVLVSTAKHGLWVKAKNGVVEFDLVQGEGGKVMPSKSYLNGKKIEKGSVL